MTDEAKAAPPRIAVQIEGASVTRIMQLLPAVSHWARAEGLPCTSPADVVELAIAVLHAQILGKARRMVEEEDAPEPRREREAVH